jgi:hypothetical protein
MLLLVLLTGAAEMMGQQSGEQDRLFYSFNLNDHVPTDHLLRAIDHFLDLSDFVSTRPLYIAILVVHRSIRS